MQYQITPGTTGQGIGVRENQLHVSSGLRNCSLNAIVPSFTKTFSGASGMTQFEGIMPFGDNASVAQPDWTPMSGAESPDWTAMRVPGMVWNPMLPVPMTPTVTFLVFPVAGAFPQDVKVKIRMAGYDQFGNHIVEETPWVTKTQTTTSQWFMVHMSKVFASVEQMWLKGANIFPSSVPGSRVAIGWCSCIDPTAAAAAAASNVLAAGFVSYYWPVIMSLLWDSGGGHATNFDLVGTAANWGIGTPLQMQPYGKPLPFQSPDILGASGMILRQRNTPTALNTVAQLPAKGQLAVAGAAPNTGVTIGRSASGFLGTPHKLGFFSVDDWVTKISGIGLGGSSTRASGVPTSYAQLGEDDIGIVATLRTTLGTQQDSNPTSSYPQG